MTTSCTVPPASTHPHLTDGGTGGVHTGTKPVIWHFYVLRCGDASLYAGITPDLEKRLAAHRAGRGARYTRGRGPIQLVYQEPIGSKPDALRREMIFKRLRRAEKLDLITTTP